MSNENKDENSEIRTLRQKLLDAVLGRKLYFRSCLPEFYLSIKCPSCKNILGISADFAHKYRETNYSYTCPYCGIQAKLEK
jgi:phage FluMu protein Com